MFSKNVSQFHYAKPVELRASDLNDEDVIGTDSWNPRPEIFNGFLKRDFELAQRNVQQTLRDAGHPLLFREIKECVLHSVDVVERVLASKIIAGIVLENKGHYSLAGLA